MRYKGYTGSIEVSLEDSCLHGRILLINDLITYEADKVEDLFGSFSSAVDRYLDYCAATGKPANRPYSGSFNVRIGEELHKSAAELATLSGTNLNDWVTNAIRQVVEKSNKVAKCKHARHNNLANA
jgi:predicted HicB family RNase H-like nuclease